MTEVVDSCIDCGKSRFKETRQSLTRGRCRNCYQRHVYALKKAGTFQATQAAPALERLFSRGVPGRNGCIIWTGAVNAATGYGQFQMSPGGDSYAHRAAYLLVKGEIPNGLVIDHACHNRDPECPGGICIHHRCINPNHLDAVTPKENTRRSPHRKSGAKQLKTHCLQGHEFTPENTMTSGGRRICRACHRRWQNEYMTRRRKAVQEAD
ncbi:HNH endonuclease signature motif containing protein [Streptomyces mirabilis]|uniref:HNH endonuclease signature motif containing protein n=1 Tax=Streptomyces mirabilis TaxID=68239 RepID=UPI0033E422AE